MDEYRHDITFGNGSILTLDTSIAAEIRGEFGIGYMVFSNAVPNDVEVQGQINDKWEHFAPLSLEAVMQNSQWQQSAHLHTAIVAQAPRHKQR